MGGRALPEIPEHAVLADGGHNPLLLAVGLRHPGEPAFLEGGTLHTVGCLSAWQLAVRRGQIDEVILRCQLWGDVQVQVLKVRPSPVKSKPFYQGTSGIDTAACMGPSPAVPTGTAPCAAQCLAPCMPDSHCAPLLLIGYELQHMCVPMP